jgi:hypothetical protein
VLFAFDTIHGYRTIFPIPLAEASSFDPDVATADDTFAARETAATGLKQIYSPMIDISHEPRWGRIAEGAGEDPYLGSVMAAARVRAVAQSVQTPSSWTILPSSSMRPPERRSLRMSQWIADLFVPSRNSNPAPSATWTVPFIFSSK